VHFGCIQNIGRKCSRRRRNYTVQHSLIRVDVEALVEVEDVEDLVREAED
jgi:hypothetical protein